MLLVERVAKAFVAEGVTAAFGIMGASTANFYSALPKRPWCVATNSSRSPSQPKQVVQARVVSRSSLRVRTLGMAAMISSRVSHSQ